MEHQKRTPLNASIIKSNNKNNSRNQHYSNSQKNKKAKQQKLFLSSSSSSKIQDVSFEFPSSNTNKKISFNEQQLIYNPMKSPLHWTKKWTKWFSFCNTQRISQINNNNNLTTISTKKRARTKSENDAAKRNSVDQDEQKKLSTTNSSYIIGRNSNENSDVQLSRTASQKHHYQQTSDKVGNSNPVLYRENPRRYSNSFFTSARYSGSRQSITSIPTSTQALQPKQSLQLSRSVDRLHNKSKRRELRYEEHNDYIPPVLHSIQCHPTIEHYRKTLNQSIDFSTDRRRSQIEPYQLKSINTRPIIPRPYSSNIPLSQSIQIMSKTTSDNNNDKSAYGKLSECHSPLIPLENPSIKAPRRIESAYSQFPIPEPIYANTQSLYDNILYPQATAKHSNRTNEREKRSCASQTQLTWTMATFSSFVDLENQSSLVPRPDSNALYSIVQHNQTRPSPLATSETIQYMSRLSPRLQYIDDQSSSSHYQNPRSASSLSNATNIEKRDGSFQTYLTLSPSQDLENHRELFHHDAGSTVLAGSIIPTDQHHHHHHHHHHRKHKSRSHNIATRDVGLQVNIQTVKKITFSPKSDESSSSTPRWSRELKSVETNTDEIIKKWDKSTSYEPTLDLATSSSQTETSESAKTIINRSTHAAQTQTKSVRDQSIETNNRGLFVCDLSSLLKPTQEESVSMLTSKRKS